MLTLTAASKTKLQEALARAEAEKLEVYDLVPMSGVYVVANPTHSSQYQVTIAKHAGRVEANCTCQARGVCKHLAAALNEMKKDLTAHKAA